MKHENAHKIKMVKKAVIAQGLIFMLLGFYALFKPETAIDILKLNLDLASLKIFAFALIVAGLSSAFLVPYILDKTIKIKR